MGSGKRHLIILLVLFFCIGCDQFSKGLVWDNLRYAPAVKLLGDTVHLRYAENPGAAFSLGASLHPTARFWFFTVGSALLLATLWLFILFRHRATHGEVLAFALIIGGGASNLLDRILKDGRVIDFVMFEFGEVRSVIFNFADVMILAGITILMVELWRTRRYTDPAWAPRMVE